MAIMKNDFSVQGGLGNLSAYKKSGSDKTILRTKGGPSKSKIKVAPSFANTRKLNKEFGDASHCGQKIKYTIYPVMHLADSNLSGRLTGLCKALQVLDTENEIGQRNIYISRFRNLMEGFQLNEAQYFETVVRQQVIYTASRENRTASVLLPDLIPGVNFYVPGKYPMFRFIVVLGVMPDPISNSLGKYGYQFTHDNTEEYETVIRTDWEPTSLNYTGKNIELHLIDGILPDDTCSMILAIGIEFGMPLTTLLINPIKHSGCAKILALR